MLDLTAVLLCGGRGERLRPFTETVPKPLVPLRDRPLLQHLVEFLDSHGVGRFVFCTGYKGEMIEAFVAAHRAPGWEAVCVDSGDASMTDRIRDARPHVPGRALVCYGDTLANVDLAALLRHHAALGVAATLTVHPLQSPFGVVECGPDDRVVRFVEKPTLPHWINIGFLVCEPAALDRIRPGSDMVAFLSELSADRELGVYRHRGRHLTVNTEKERAEAERQLTDFYTLPRGDDE